MKITDLLTKEFIDLNVKASSKKRCNRTSSRAYGEKWKLK